MSKLQIGDTIAYTAKFLKSIADFSKRSADKRGVITRIEDFGDIVIVYANGDFTGYGVNVKNVCSIKNKIGLYDT